MPVLFTASVDRVEVDRGPNAVLLYVATPNVEIRSVAVLIGMVLSVVTRSVKVPSATVLNVEIQNARVPSAAIRIAKVQIAVILNVVIQNAAAPPCVELRCVELQCAQVLSVVVRLEAIQFEATLAEATQFVVPDALRVVPILVLRAVGAPVVSRVSGRCCSPALPARADPLEASRAAFLPVGSPVVHYAAAPEPLERSRSPVDFARVSLVLQAKSV